MQLIDMYVKQIEKEVLDNFNNGKYSPTGADGGVLKYIYCNCSFGTAYASITLDQDIAQIRAIWQLAIDPDGNGRKEVYNFTKKYYQLRK